MEPNWTVSQSLSDLLRIGEVEGVEEVGGAPIGGVAETEVSCTGVLMFVYLKL